ncbi:MAG: phosphodiester glycosidase family protein [Eubacteriales bacterium]
MKEKKSALAKKKRILIIILSFLVIIGCIIYALADRYLIAHVQISDVKTYESLAKAASPTQASDPAAESSSDAASAAASGTTAAASGNIMSYTSDAASITITPVTTGSGSSIVTYYVADVVLSDASNLKTAFARDQFGTNIIENTSVIAAGNNAVFAVNGDYYGFRTDGIEIRNGVIYRDNPVRTGLAFYLDGSMKVYDETTASADQLLADGVWNTLSFGPAILVDGVIPDNIDNVEVDTNVGNHSIQGNQPRTGIGVIDDNHFVFIVVDGRSKGYSIGVTMPEFAEIFKNLGCTTAYNLDGGGSSTMYFKGSVINNPLGKGQERGVSDILYIG